MRSTTDGGRLIDTVRHIVAGLGPNDTQLQRVRDDLSEALQQHFQVSTVSLWCLDLMASPMVLHCVSLHTAQGQRPPYGPLAEEEYGEYLRWVMREGVYACSNVDEDPNLQGLQPYFRRHGVQALLDAAFQVNGRPRGVVCLEHTGGPRTWTPAEKSLLRRVSAEASLAIARMEAMPRLPSERP
ncbi:GAF domain-containing protein [Aquabacterium sp. J223]|uniref:GAF domain-containing protein n=1 Tax=Aquabacterium sp. J223 TaxID=2898431 RepID=UPI0021AD7E88|nr:GAF domain-containing protein [Aquabacterium sp. J223]UUX95629.1 GAF domain-containing protein [Aquabacterium sp. J223]